MGTYKRCPICKHINLERAVFCFQCGEPLGKRPASGAKPPASRRSQRIVETMWGPDEDHYRAVSGVSGTALLSELRLEEPLTCLSCGALNRPTARYCTSCGIELLIPHSQSGLLARVSGRSDTGKLRENNEDSIGLWSVHGALLALVADGMGGAVAGEEASRLTVEAVQADFVGEGRGGAALLSLAEELIMDKLAGAIQSANMAVIDRVDRDARLQGMGTTATLAFVHGRRAMVAHVGDSRAYLVDGEQGWINQITSDHSFVEALLAAGHITEEQVEQHPMRNVLYRALGQTPDTTADVYDRYLKAGDRIVLCSDGLTRHVAPRELADIVLEETRPESATQRLIDLANKRGGEDNISIVVIYLEHTADSTTELAALTDEEIRRRKNETGLLSVSESEPEDASASAALAAHLEMLRSLGFGDEDLDDPTVSEKRDQ
ncbi:MAG: Stp1/IreP family PP2C-type Ser/Thr phosphatase [Anaerolineae bacterium]|nr:Stp1/IreP family PP2C-type Ser/Thr phosphatase [Anaerolineae bacterium]